MNMTFIPKARYKLSFFQDGKSEYYRICQRSKVIFTFSADIRKSLTRSMHNLLLNHVAIA